MNSSLRVITSISSGDHDEKCMTQLLINVIFVSVSTACRIKMLQVSSICA